MRNIRDLLDRFPGILDDRDGFIFNFDSHCNECVQEKKWRSSDGCSMMLVTELKKVEKRLAGEGVVESLSFEFERENLVSPRDLCLYLLLPIINIICWSYFPLR